MFIKHGACASQTEIEEDRRSRPTVVGSRFSIGPGANLKIQIFIHNLKKLEHGRLLVFKDTWKLITTHFCASYQARS
jgi:hypothetical protein